MTKYVLNEQAIEPPQEPVSGQAIDFYTAPCNNGKTKKLCTRPIVSESSTPEGDLLFKKGSSESLMVPGGEGVEINDDRAVLFDRYGQPFDISGLVASTGISGELFTESGIRIGKEGNMLVVRFPSGVDVIISNGRIDQLQRAGKDGTWSTYSFRTLKTR